MRAKREEGGPPCGLHEASYDQNFTACRTTADPLPITDAPANPHTIPAALSSATLGYLRVGCNRDDQDPRVVLRCAALPGHCHAVLPESLLARRRRQFAAAPQN